MWGTGAEKNPPVTASPCQPPLGKGAKGTGDADCHGQFANWPRNDRLQEMRWGGRGRTPPLRKRILRCIGEGLCPSRGRGRTPPLRKHNKRCNGRATARVAPTEAQQEVQRAGRPGGRPLRVVTRGTTGGPMWASAPTDVLQGVRWGGRGRTPPLRGGYRRCNGRVVWEADPYGRLQEVRGFMPGRRWWGCCSRVYRHPRGGGGCGW